MVGHIKIRMQFHPSIRKNRDPIRNRHKDRVNIARIIRPHRIWKSMISQSRHFDNRHLRDRVGAVLRVVARVRVEEEDQFMS